MFHIISWALHYAEIPAPLPILYTNRPLWMSPGAWLDGTLVASPSRRGWYNIALAGGRMLSIGLASTKFAYTSRPAGTDTIAEQFALTTKGNLYVKPDTGAAAGTVIGCECLPVVVPGV